MVQAEWNGISWEVSPSRVTGISSLSTSRSVSVERNEDKEGEPATQTVAYDLQTLDIEYPVAKSAGEDPRSAYGRWWGLLGVYAPFYLNGRQFLACDMMLKSVSLSDVSLSSDGDILTDKIKLSFEEYAEDASGLKLDKLEGASVRPGISTQSVTSAVGVGPSDSQRQGKMPSNPGM